MLLDYESCCTEKWLVSYYDIGVKSMVFCLRSQP